MVFLSEKQVKDLFMDLFNVLVFEEIEKDGKTGLGKMKHWHIYNVIAQKNNTRKDIINEKSKLQRFSR